MFLDASVRCTGRFRAIVHTGHEYDRFGNIVREGIVLKETPFGRNKITLTGFNGLFAGNLTLSMVAGAGNTAPSEGDTTLVSYLGKSNTIASSSTTRNTTPDVNGDVWWRMTKRYTFGPGALGGGSVNVAEVGMSAVSYNSINAAAAVSARGLLVDEVGNPVTVAVNNATEYLDVIWEYTEWVKASVTGTVSLTIDGTPTNHSYEVRPYRFDNPGGSYNYGPWQPSDGAGLAGWGPVGDGTDSWDDASNVFAGPLVAITGDGLGSGVRGNLPTIASAAYVANSKQRAINMTWLPLQANLTGGIGVIRVTLGHTGWQVSFAPKILKVDTKQLDMQFTLSMGNKP